MKTYGKKITKLKTPKVKGVKVQEVKMPKMRFGGKKSGSGGANYYTKIFKK